MATWESRVQRVQAAVDAWRPRLMSPETPETGSSLAKDDETLPGMPCSQLAWWGLSVAVEHLDATLRLLAQQIESGGPLLPAANFTVLRAGLVGASQAAVLLLPGKREERTTYGLQIAHEEYKQALNFRRHLQDHDGLVGQARAAYREQDFLGPLDAAKRRARALLDARAAESKLFDTDMVEEAATLVHRRGADAAMLQLALEMEWRLGSGAAHGRLLMGLHRPGGHRVEDSKVALLGGTYQEIAMQIGAISLVLSEAWRMWDLRRVGLDLGRAGDRATPLRGSRLLHQAPLCPGVHGAAESAESPQQLRR